MIHGALTGRRYGLLVVGAVESTGASGEPRYHCRCDCGRSTIVWGSNLRSGNTSSCGDHRRHMAVIGQVAALRAMRPGRPIA